MKEEVNHHIVLASKYLVSFVIMYILESHDLSKSLVCQSVALAWYPFAKSRDLEFLFR